MEQVQQRIFKEGFLQRLRADLKHGRSVAEYFKEEVEYPESETLASTIKVDPSRLELAVAKEGDQSALDFENAKRIYEAYGELTETQASDPRLWAYLAHATFRKYTMARWGAGPSEKEATANKEARSRAARQILSHWFAGGNDRSLRRHAIARLWWAAHLTYAPWERDPFFEELAGEDPYKFTKILFSTQDVFQQVLERGVGRNNRILIAVLDYVGERPELSREGMRNLMKEINLISSVRNPGLLSWQELKELIRGTGERAA